MTGQPQLPFVAPRWFRHGTALNLTRTPCGLCVEAPETLIAQGFPGSEQVQCGDGAASTARPLAEHSEVPDMPDCTHPPLLLAESSGP